MNALVNKVEQSGILVIDLAELIPAPKYIRLDLGDFLDGGVVLRERAFRLALKSFAWEEYNGHSVLLCYPKEAIIPRWAFMLVMSYLNPHAKNVVVGTDRDMHRYWTEKVISEVDLLSYRNKRVILKGCTASHIEENAYALMSNRLIGIVQSLMYGEPCSSVPVYKRKAASA